MYVTKRTVTKSFRKILEHTYPNLKRNPAYWPMIGYLAFGTFRDEVSNKLVIPSEIIAEIEGKKHLLTGKNYIADKFLKLFIKDIQPFEYSKWDFLDRRARVVTKLDWPQHIATAISEERQRPRFDTDRVYLDDGSAYTKYKQLKYLNLDRKESLLRMGKSGCKEAKELLTYMNNLPSNLFHRLFTNMPVALEVAQKLPYYSRNHQIDLLHAIVDQYMPLYKSTDGSSRIYPLNENMLCLQRDVRKTLTKGWFEADLKSAQLAICAKMWGVQNVQDFLEKGGSIWKHLFKLFRLQFNQDTKDIFKKALYALMYGGDKRLFTHSEHGILNPLGIQNAYEIFLSSPLVRAMKRARTKRFKQIVNAGGATNYFGQWIPLTRNKGVDGGFSKKSILAQQAQSVELALLYPIIKAAMENRGKNGVTIVLWQHDGFSFVVGNKTREEWWKSYFKFLVESRAYDMGVKTELEIA